MRRAYTLIEILVVITIIGILFGTGYASFRDFSRRQALTGVAKTLQGDIRLVQEQAISGKKPADPYCTEPNLLDGYNFKVNSDSIPPSYSIEAKCTEGVVEIKSVNIPSDVNIVAPSPNPVFFKALGQGTNIPSGENATITLKQVSTSNTITVIVSSSGEIQ